MNFYKTVLNILSLFLVLFCNFDKVESVKKISPKNSLVGINKDNIEICLNNCYLTIKGKGYYEINRNFFGKFKHLKRFVNCINLKSSLRHSRSMFFCKTKHHWYFTNRTNRQHTSKYFFVIYKINLRTWLKNFKIKLFTLKFDYMILII